MSMAKHSVPQAAAHLGVSPARVRQRIRDGSLVAEKIGGRWVVDLDFAAAVARPARGRPVSPGSVWFSMLALDSDSLVDVPQVGLPKIDLPTIESAWPDMAREVRRLSSASRYRAASRLEAAMAQADHDAILAWLRNRGRRRLFVAPDADLDSLRNDHRFMPSGVSLPHSRMSDPRIAEGYVAAADMDSIVQDHWLDPLSLDDRPNVVIHVVPALPPRISRLLLAADLAEHGGPRELRRAHELVDAVIADHQDHQ